jgi:predicted hydrocarbon binding protein
MPPPDDFSSASPLDHVFDPAACVVDAAAGTVTDPIGTRVAYAAPEFARAIHFVLLKEKSSLWREALAHTGRACGRDFGLSLDREFTRLGQPALGALPLEECLVLLERAFVAHGWGVLKVDLADAADHGLVTAHLTHSYFAAVLPNANDFVDHYPAGLLRGFFEHISGEQLDCVEIACVRRGADRCTFVITATERLAAVAPFLGRESAEAILGRLKA